MDIIISFIESIYLCYMFNYFKTKIYFSHPFDMFTSKQPFIHHDISNKNINKICPLGNLVGWLFPLWFLGRHCIKNKNFRNKWNNRIILLLLIGSLLTNINAFIYCLPIFIYELCSS